MTKLTHPPRRSAILALVVFALATLLAACSDAGGSATPPPEPAQTPVTTPDEAVAAVIAIDPRLTGIGALDPDLIGQASWYEVAPGADGAFVVTVRVGWGDCPAGCISEHTWTWVVQPDGTVGLESESGDLVPPDAWPSPGGDGRTGLLISATSGPTCPVEQDPPDPACAPRPVAGALAIIRDTAGAEVTGATLDERGFAFVELPPGGYVVEAQPVEGLLGTPSPVSATVVAGAGALVELAYDTGIR